MNYARHIGSATEKGTRVEVLFNGDPPFPEAEYNKWAFWAIPRGHTNRTFHGCLIGETPDLRAERLGLKGK